MTGTFSRRAFLSGVSLSLVAAGVRANALHGPQSSGINPQLLTRALAAMRRQSPHLRATDRMAVVDFTLPSKSPRMYLVDLQTQAVHSVLVAHGLGSDPHYTGWLIRFSNVPGSLATSAGGYVTGPAYIGEHGHSLRLQGLDRTNSNAEDRDIVIHSAWYVSRERALSTGKIGRSDGCFAVAQTSLEQVLDHLGTGRFLYAEKLAA
ncbi:MAG: murein L,D-transpeptidase catalytic domain family protein [Rhizomicrobium sp.]